MSDMFTYCIYNVRYVYVLYIMLAILCGPVIREIIRDCFSLTKSNHISKKQPTCTLSHVKSTDERKFCSINNVHIM